jgi:2-C-methyl-D-erythritol 4-phosphate cytidylyltransferase
MRFNKYAIIVAGGSGTRMGSEIPKQFLEVGGIPILIRTILQFKKADSAVQVILVLPKSQFSFWQELTSKHNFTLSYQLVSGGDSRFQSVQNGLNSISDSKGLVAIHDGVRPFISQEIINESFRIAQEKTNAVVSVPLKDSIRFVDENGVNQAKPRSQYRSIQTPQTFQLNLLREAFEVEESNQFTDDATVFEHAGHKINLIEGSYKNIKITTPEDLLLGEGFLV